jgi:hypothetical protein
MRTADHVVVTWLTTWRIFVYLLSSPWMSNKESGNCHVFTIHNETTMAVISALLRIFVENYVQNTVSSQPKGQPWRQKSVGVREDISPNFNRTPLNISWNFAALISGEFFFSWHLFVKVLGIAWPCPEHVVLPWTNDMRSSVVDIYSPGYTACSYLSQKSVKRWRVSWRTS